MKNLVKLVFLVGIVWVFVGCSGSYGIQYDTKPSCARIVCNGTFQGYAPVTLYYNKDNIDDNDILYTQQCKVVFESGYEETFNNRIDTNKYPDGIHTTITRPQGVGYSQDRDFVCSNACIYSIATRLWNENPYYFSKNRISKYDIFLDFKRDFYYSGTCP